MAEPSKTNGSSERTKSARDIFNQSRSIAGRLFSRSAQERVMDTADRYANNIRSYLGGNYNIDTQVPRSVYMGRQNNRAALNEIEAFNRARNRKRGPLMTYGGRNFRGVRPTDL